MMFIRRKTYDKVIEKIDALEAEIANGLKANTNEVFGSVKKCECTECNAYEQDRQEREKRFRKLFS
ncbi:hypothetical protein [Gracilibacillus lacisalsi]|uniref:hypothetical protein n=1 Tax=Gracilibacillus lacisalsi TaxID=393087 RepID=UPI0003799331|nr:hypothetical protein [Gracilibacillus lacisalsi]